MANISKAAAGWVDSDVQTFRTRLRELVPILHLTMSLDDNNEILATLDEIKRKLDAKGSETGFGDFDKLYLREPLPVDIDDDQYILGRGAVGVTERRKSAEDGRLFCVKVVSLKLAQAAGLSEKDVKGEAALLEGLTHPNIVRYFMSYTGVGRRSSSFHIVMELLDRGSLATQVGPSHSDEVLGRWLKQLAGALSYMHEEARVLHRDLKPENVLLSSKGQIKIIDVGLAVVIQSSVAARSKVGTSTYASYEKSNGKPYDGRDDVWAVGCIMLELVRRARLARCLNNYFDAEISAERVRCVKSAQALCSSSMGSLLDLMLEPAQEQRIRASVLFSRTLTPVSAGSDAIPAKNGGDTPPPPIPPPVATPVCPKPTPPKEKPLSQSPKWSTALQEVASIDLIKDGVVCEKCGPGDWGYKSRYILLRYEETLSEWRIMWAKSVSAEDVAQGKCLSLRSLKSVGYINTNGSPSTAQTTHVRLQIADTAMNLKFFHLIAAGAYFRCLGEIAPSAGNSTASIPPPVATQASSKPAPPTPATSQQFKLGDAVECCENGSLWRPGKVGHIWSDGVYRVDYSDGRGGWAHSIAGSKLRVAGTGTVTALPAFKYKCGDAVECCENGSLWRPGKVGHIWSDGEYRVDFSDGRGGWAHSAASASIAESKLRVAGTGTVTPQKYKCGDAVECCENGSLWRPGKVDHIWSDGEYIVNYSDGRGGSASKIAGSKVRLAGTGTVTPLPAFKYKCGDAVECCENGSLWRPGKVDHIWSDGEYIVNYSDGRGGSATKIAESKLRKCISK